MNSNSGSDSDIDEDDDNECEFCGFDFDVANESEIEECFICKQRWCPDCLLDDENQSRGCYVPSQLFCNKCCLSYCNECVGKDSASFKQICVTTTQGKQLIALGDHPIVRGHDKAALHDGGTMCRIKRRKFIKEKDVWFCLECNNAFGYFADSGDFVNIDDIDDL